MMEQIINLKDGLHKDIEDQENTVKDIKLKLCYH